MQIKIKTFGNKLNNLKIVQTNVTYMLMVEINLLLHIIATSEISTGH